MSRSSFKDNFTRKHFRKYKRLSAFNTQSIEKLTGYCLPFPLILSTHTGCHNKLTANEHGEIIKKYAETTNHASKEHKEDYQNHGKR